MSCDGCNTTVAADRQKFEQTRKKAKQYAIEVQKDMAIYKEGYEYDYIQADIAISDGYLVVDIVSYHRSTST